MEKAKKEIYGSPVLPIRIGQRALIDVSSGRMCTTQVLHTIQRNRTLLVFETQNTWYTLHVTGGVAL